MSEVQELIENLEDAFQAFKTYARRNARPIDFERWKASGYMVDEGIATMYSNARKLADLMEPEEDEDTGEMDALKQDILRQQDHDHSMNG